MSAVAAEPPHLVQLEIRRTFLTRSSPTRPSTSLPRTAAAHAQAADHRVHHAAGHSPERERREETPPPPANIYLGETYTASVQISVPANAAPHAAHQVHLAVEMHSGIPPPLLATRTAGTPPPPVPPQIRQYPLSKHDFERIEPSPPGEEIVVPLEWELKDLASHAVVCLVSYGVQVADRETGQLELVRRSYRKILRFEVLNPLSVRTKAHAPSSPSFSPNTFYSPLARRKLFLEVQVQNNCDSRMTLRRMRFEPVEGFRVSDQANQGFVDVGVVDPQTTEDESAQQQQQERAGLDFLPLSTGSVRQFLYVLTRSAPTHLSDAVAGAAQQQQQEPLGRLDIVWQTESGQQGRLQSATLGRKLPPPPPPPPAGPTSPNPRFGVETERLQAKSSSPPGLSGGGGGDTAPSDLGDGDVVGEPAGAKGLKFDVTVEAVVPSSSPPPPPPPRSETATAGAISRSTFLVNEPVSVRLRIRVARDRDNDRALSNLTTTTTPTGARVYAGAALRRRRVRVAIQHVQWHSSPIRDQITLVRHRRSDNDDGNDKARDDDDELAGSLGPRREESISSSSFAAIPGAMPSPSYISSRSRLPGVTSLQQQQSLLAATRNHNNGRATAVGSASSGGGNTFAVAARLDNNNAAAAAGRSYPMMHGVRLPLPIPIQPPPPAGPAPSAGVIRLGPDTLDVGYLDVLDVLDDDDVEGGSAGGGGRVVEMRFVPLERGLIRFGGVRVLVLPPSSSFTAEVEPGAPVEGSSDVDDAETVWEASSIAEIWCE